MPDDVPLHELQELELDTVSGVADPANETDGWLVVRSGSASALDESITEESDMPLEAAPENAAASETETVDENAEQPSEAAGEPGDAGTAAGSESAPASAPALSQEQLAERYEQVERARRSERQRNDELNKRNGELDERNQSLAAEIAELRRSQQETQLRLDVERATEEVRAMGGVAGDAQRWASHLVILRMDPNLKSTAAAFEELLQANSKLVRSTVNTEIGSSESADDENDPLSVIRARATTDDGRSESQKMRDGFATMTRAEQQEFVNDYYSNRAVGR